MSVLHLAYPDDAEVDALVHEYVDSRIVSRIFEHDASLWGDQAQDEASKRLGWTHLAQESRDLLQPIAALRDVLDQRGITRVVLCGMGGSSLAPEVICADAGVDLVVLDSSQPDMVRSVVETDLAATAVVVSSKSGGTVETDSQRRVFEQAFTDHGIDPAERIVVVTDPGSPLESEAEERGYRVFGANSEVGGRYSALTAFGLVPSGLAGVDIAELLATAEERLDLLSQDSSDNPALTLGVMLGVASRRGVDKLVLADETGHGLGDWIEQLIAESTGKQGRGILPVVVESLDVPGADPASRDSIVVALGAREAAPSSPSGFAASVDADLGAQFLLWEVATAIAGRIIGIDPFDQPDVESAKQASRDLLDGGSSGDDPDFIEDGIEVFGTTETTVAAALDALFAELEHDGSYLAIQAYLDRWTYAQLSEIRADLNTQLSRPVTFGWGPRFLHSTGQYHKGGPATGAYLQVTSEPDEDLAVPGRDFTLFEFITSQVSGDGSVLRSKGRPVLRLHFSSAAEAARRLPELVRRSV